MMMMKLLSYFIVYFLEYKFLYKITKKEKKAKYKIFFDDVKKITGTSVHTSIRPNDMMMMINRWSFFSGLYGSIWIFFCKKEI